MTVDDSWIAATALSLGVPIVTRVHADLHLGQVLRGGDERLQRCAGLCASNRRGFRPARCFS